VGLIGDVSRVNCSITPESQGFSVQLFKLACNYDGGDAEVDHNRGGIVAAQRSAEIEIINEKLMTDPPYVGWDFTSFNEDSLVILDCQRANGGICVINAWSDTYIHVTSFRPTKSSLRDEILIQPSFFLEHQTSDLTAEDEPREEVSEAAMMIRQSRYIFDHPEIEQTVRDTVSEGVNILLNLILHND